MFVDLGVIDSLLLVRCTELQETESPDNNGSLEDLGWSGEGWPSFAHRVTDVVKGRAFSGFPKFLNP